MDGEEMRLLLLGFIREEKKFNGLDELLSTIRSDIDTARADLETSPLAELANAPWLRAVDDGAASMRLIDAQSDEVFPAGPPEATAKSDSSAPKEEEGEEEEEEWVSSFAAPPEGMDCSDEEECIIEFGDDDDNDER